MISSRLTIISLQQGFGGLSPFRGAQGWYVIPPPVEIFLNFYICFNDLGSIDKLFYSIFCKLESDRRIVPKHETDQIFYY